MRQLISAQAIPTVAEPFEDRFLAARLFVDVVPEASYGNGRSKQALDSLVERHKP